MVPLRPLLTPDASLGTIDLPVLRQTIRTRRPPPPAGVAANGEHAADCAPHPQDRQRNPCPARRSVPGRRRFPSSASARLWLDSCVLTRTPPPVSRDRPRLTGNRRRDE